MNVSQLIDVCEVPLPYARTLVDLEEGRCKPRLVVAMAGGSLLDRVRRLSGQEYCVREASGSVFAALSLAMLSILLVIGAQQSSAETGRDSDADEALDVEASPQDAHVAELGWRSRSDAQPNVLHGRCVDEADRPIPGVNIVILRGNLRYGPQELLHKTITDERGAFRIESIIDARAAYPNHDVPLTPRPDEPRVIWGAYKEGRISRSGARDQSEIVRLGQSMDFVMPTGASLRGRVVDVYGRPVGNALVASLTRMVRLDGFMSARTDASGNFVIDDLAPFDLEAELRREAEQERQNKTSLASGATYVLSGSFAPRFLVTHPNYEFHHSLPMEVPGEFDATLVRGGILSGQVLGADGAPVSGALVQLHQSIPQRANSAAIDNKEFDRYSWYDAVVVADEAGRYTFSSLKPGKYDVWVESPNWVHCGLDSVEVDLGEAVNAPPLRPSPTGTVRLQLLDVRTGKPIASDQALIASVSWNMEDKPSRQRISEQRVPVSPGATIEIPVLPGKLVMFVSGVSRQEKPAWKSAGLSLNVTEGAIETADLALQPAED